jgi:hypothetical protein
MATANPHTLRTRVTLVSSPCALLVFSSGLSPPKLSQRRVPGLAMPYIAPGGRCAPQPIFKGHRRHFPEHVRARPAKAVDLSC